MLADPYIGKAKLLGLGRGAADRVRSRLASDMGQMNAEPHDPVSDAVPDRNVKPRAAARKGGGRTISNELYATQPLLRGRQTGIVSPRQRPDGRGRRIELDALV